MRNLLKIQINHNKINVQTCKFKLVVVSLQLFLLITFYNGLLPSASFSCYICLILWLGHLKELPPLCNWVLQLITKHGGSSTGFANWLFEQVIIVFIIYRPSMYCSKYRSYQVVEYKPADHIFRITTVWFSKSVSCLSDM